MNQSPSKTYWHNAYEPLPVAWVFYVRCAQLGLTLLTLGLTSYAASQLILGSGIDFTFFTTVWSLLWIAISTWGLAYIPAHHRPNFAALAVELITCLWWLVSLGLLGSTAAIYASAVAIYDSYGITESLDLPDWRAGTHATQGATAVAALNWVLFIVTLYAVIKKIRSQRPTQIQGAQQHNTDNTFSAHPDDNSFDTDKTMHTPSNVV